MVYEQITLKCLKIFLTRITQLTHSFSIACKVANEVLC